mgnify:CR=1 FL=1
MKRAGIVRSTEAGVLLRIIDYDNPQDEGIVAEMEWSEAILLVRNILGYVQGAVDKQIREPAFQAKLKALIEQSH